MTVDEPERPSKWLRRLAKLALALAVVGFGVYILGEVYKGKDHLPDFIERRQRLVSVERSIVEQGDGFSVVHIELEGERGLRVDGDLKVPAGGVGPRGTLVILGGLRTGRRTIGYLGDTGDWLVLALDYPYHGKKSGLSAWEFVSGLPEMRAAMLDTVPAAMLGLDYLWQREDVDRRRVVLAGGSFGALFSPAVAAADPRITAVAIFFGAGDIGALAEANLGELWWPARPLVAWLGSVVTSPVEPLKYVHRISPRPLFMLNGSDDPAMPERCSQLLHDRAGEPKTVCWLPLGHVNIRDTEFHLQVLEQFVDWLREIGYVSDAEAFTLGRGR